MPIALLLKPSGATLARLEVGELPAALEYGGQRWQRAWTTVTGAAYEVERVVRSRATGAAPVARWVRVRRQGAD